MQGHYKDFLASTGMLLFYVAVLLLWGYQVGQWLRTSCSRSERTADDGVFCISPEGVYFSNTTR